MYDDLFPIYPPAFAPGAGSIYSASFLMPPQRTPFPAYRFGNWQNIGPQTGADRDVYRPAPEEDQQTSRGATFPPPPRPPGSPDDKDADASNRADQPEQPDQPGNPASRSLLDMLAPPIGNAWFNPFGQGFGGTPNRNRSLQTAGLGLRFMQGGLYGGPSMTPPGGWAFR